MTKIKIFRQCLFDRRFTDEQGGSQIGIFHLVTGLPFALVEAERWLSEQSERPCIVRCSVVSPALQSAAEQAVAAFVTEGEGRRET